MEELVVYREILKAIKVSFSNLDLESDMNEENINKEIIENILINDIEIQEKAKESLFKIFIC